MKAEDVAWVVLLAVATAAFGGMCLLGVGCDVYEVPCSLEEKSPTGTTVCLDVEPECVCDGGVDG